MMGEIAFYCFALKCLTSLLFAQEHLQSLVDLQKLVDSVIDSTTHPHAIDGQKLSRLQSADDDTDMHKGTANQPQAAHFVSNSVDIVQLLQVGCLGVDSSPIPAANARVNVVLVNMSSHVLAGGNIVTHSFSC